MESFFLYFTSVFYLLLLVWILILYYGLFSIYYFLFIYLFIYLFTTYLRRFASQAPLSACPSASELESALHFWAHDEAVHLRDGSSSPTVTDVRSTACHLAVLRWLSDLAASSPEVHYAVEVRLFF
jgi:hypothetical protein